MFLKKGNKVWNDFLFPTLFLPYGHTRVGGTKDEVREEVIYRKKGVSYFSVFVCQEDGLQQRNPKNARFKKLLVIFDSCKEN